ncbi:MAG: 30S ribosomal protein S9 [Patescibacteria group bacterium]
MVKQETKKSAKVSHKYFEGIGRRKTAVARVRITKEGTKFSINDKKVADYFPLKKLQTVAESSLNDLQLLGKYGVDAHVSGGGIAAQAEAVRHGVARALIVSDEALKPRLRALGFTTRDPRMVERKKYGLKKARRAPQWAKR